MLYAILIAFQMIISGNNLNAETGTIKVQVKEFRNTEGHLLVSLFNSSEHFPDKGEKAFRTKKVKVNKKVHEVVFEDVPYGEYAVIFLHDENDNEDMDTNFVGAPKEGYGTSNDAVNTFSAPKYEEAKFTLNSSTKNLSLKIFY
ncbi:hypothetical protein GCM10011506_12280 [Marivirga lumbricoides]|uniref:DUF2141 domain-containing protein n=1 Tax=Marivirga lumbricoides TaxID=1046115 RepID=A0ABQ1LR46_9BACT|nr:hypothetical protein GCM10011506_12280 [Marivirga lumbricoides]